MSKEEMKLRLIEVIADLGSEEYINALYEIIIYEDFDYIENLFPTKEEFKEFIAKYREKNNEIR